MSIEEISEKHSLANDPPDEPSKSELTRDDVHALAETMIEEELAKGDVYGTDRVERDARIQALEDFIRRLDE